MCRLINETVEEMNLLANTKKTAMYLFDAICQEDFQSAQLELLELKNAIKKLEDIQKKRERKEMLVALMIDMRARGINIDFARKASFLNNNAKNVVEDDQKNSKIHKKRQQA